MKKWSVGKYSLVGLILFCSSAVTAAVLNSQKDKTLLKREQEGSLTISDPRNPLQFTCKPTDCITTPCTDTITDAINSFTTELYGFSSDETTGNR